MPANYAAARLPVSAVIWGLLSATAVCGEDIVIDTHTTWAAGTYEYDAVLVTAGATLTCEGQVLLHAASVTVEAGAAISADSRGYPAQQGPGAPSARRGGAGYGGAGLYGGGTYGSALAPKERPLGTAPPSRR